MSLRKRSLMYAMVVLGLVAVSIVVIATKPTLLGLDLQGGAEVILEASPTADAEVTPDSLRRAVNTINNRVNRLGVTEPEIQVQGSNKIRVALPGVEDPTVVNDLVKSAQLLIYPYQRTLVGYEAPPKGQGAPVGVNPTTDLYRLIQYAETQSPAPVRDGAEPSYYLFRSGTTHAYVAGVEGGPFNSVTTLRRRLETANPAVAAEWKAKPKAFDLQRLPAGFVIVTDASNFEGSYQDAPLCAVSGGTCVLLYDRPAASGQDIKGANMSTDQLNRPAVAIQFTDKGRKRFAELTKMLVKDAQKEARPSTDPDRFHNFALTLDSVIISRPYVSYVDNPNGIDSDSAEIGGGGFTEKSARTLADQIASGSIPIRLEPVSTSTIGASLGEDSLRQGMIGAFIGIGLVVIGLILYYRLLGVIATMILAIYGVYLWAVVKLIPVALTLPGIAGVILTVGVAADASVIIFERVREEMRQGRPPRTAVLSGYRRGITAIVDGNIVTLLTAVFIFLLSTSGPRGFALMLLMGVLLALFTAVIATPAFLGLLVESRLFKNEKLVGLTSREPRWKMDVVGRWKFWIAISFVPLIVGLVWVLSFGIKQGMDFTGGSEQRIAFTTQPNEDAVRDLVTSLGHPDAKIQSFKDQSHEGFTVATKELNTGEIDAIRQAFPKTFPGAEVIQSLNVGPTFGRDVVKNAMWAIFFSFLAITAYLTIRFEIKLALPALLTVVHDVWLSLTIYSIAGREVTGESVAAFLTILGYSLYDVVIVFDRIRENEPLMRGRPYREIVNRSLHETLTRSIIAMISTLLPVLALFIFGGEPLRDFSFALLVGILAGGVSSLFIAAPLAGIWKEHEPDQKRLAARRAKRAARAAQVDADIVDVGALRRAEAAMAGAEVSASETLGLGPLGNEGLEESSSGPAPSDGPSTSPSGTSDGDDAPTASVETTDPAEPSAGGSDAPADDKPSRPKAPPPPERQRRHRNVQRKRRR